MSESESAENYWNSFAIGAPARRALIDAQILDLKQYAAIDSEYIQSLHGMGPKAIEILNQAVQEGREIK